MRKNVANQTEDFQSVSITTGGPVLGVPEVYITQGTGPAVLGTGSFTHKGRGQWQYAFTQAETNADKLAVQFVLAGAVTQVINLYPVAYDPANALNLGLGALVDILGDTAELQTNQGDWATATGFSTFNAAVDEVLLVSNQPGASIGAVGTVTDGAKSADALVNTTWTDALAALIGTINTNTSRIPADPATETSLADKMPIGHLNATAGVLDEVSIAANAALAVDQAAMQVSINNLQTAVDNAANSQFDPAASNVNLAPNQDGVTIGNVDVVGTVTDGAKSTVLTALSATATSTQNSVTNAQFGLAALQQLLSLIQLNMNLIAGSNGTIVSTVSIAAIASAVGGGGGSSLWTQGEIDTLTAQVAALDSRVPSQAIWDYVEAHAKASQPVVFAGGTSIQSVITSIDGLAPPEYSDTINGRILYFDNALSPNYRSIVRIVSYDGVSKLAQFTSLTSPVTENETAILI